MSCPKPAAPVISGLPALDRLTLPADAHDSLLGLFQALGVDADYVGYRRLARVARRVMALAIALSLPIPDTRCTLAALDALLALPVADDDRSLVDTAEADAALLSRRYPLIAALLAHVAPQEREPIDRLRAVLITTALLAAPDPPPPILKSAATQLRLAPRAADLRRDIIAEMPALRARRLSLPALATNCSTLLRRPDLTSTQRTCVRSFSRLTQTLISLTTRGVTSDTQLSVPSLLQPPLGGVEEGPAPEVLATASVPAPDGTDSTDGEAPDVALLWSEPPNAEPISLRGLRAQGTRSAYWLAATSAALPWDRGVLLPMQQALLVRHLRAAAASRDDPDRRAAAICALMLCTGLSPEGVAALTLGQDIDIGTGLYRRVVPGHQDGATPDAGIRHLYRRITGVIELPLPERVRALLPEADTGTIGSWAAASNPQWREMLSAALARLPTAEIQRITDSRVARVLAHRLQQRYGDIGLTYLLAGNALQQPPVDLYYSAYSADRLVGAYVHVTASLFASCQ